MTKIYDSFSEFRSENKSIFKFLSKSDGRGLQEAIWNARDGEVELLKKRIYKLEQELLSKNQNLDTTIDELGELKNYQEEYFKFKRQNEELINENKKQKEAILDLEQKEKNTKIRYEKSLDLIKQLEMHIGRQSDMHRELQENYNELQTRYTEASKSHDPLIEELKELKAHFELQRIDLERYKLFCDQGEIYSEQLEEHIEKLKANSFALKEVAQKAKDDKHAALSEIQKQKENENELLKKIAEAGSCIEKLNLQLKEQNDFIEELKIGVRNLKFDLSIKTTTIGQKDIELGEIKKTFDALKASEHFHRTEYQKAKAELEKIRMEKERLSGELKWLNSTIKDIQSSLGHIHHQYARTPQLEN